MNLPFGLEIRRAEMRVSPENPRVPLSDPKALLALFGLTPGNIPAVTAESALTVPAYGAGVAFLTRSLANLPLHAFTSKAEGGSERITGKLQRILNEAPNPEWTSFGLRQYFWQQVFSSPAGRGLIYIERVGKAPDSLWPMDATTTTVKRVSGRKVYNYNGKDYQAEDVIDVPFMLKSDQLGSHSPLVLGSKVLSLALAMNEYAAGFFANGGVPPLQMVGPLAGGPDAQRRALADQRKAIEAAKQSESQIIATAAGYELKAVGFDPAKGQMTEAMRFIIEEIARLLSLPPVFVGDLTHGSYANTEQQDLHLVKHLLAQWAKALEEELNLKLFGAANNRRYVEHAMDGVMRGDFKTRMEGMARGVQSGLITPNEGRALDNRPPKPNGDVLYIQGATVPLGSQPQDGATPPGDEGGAA